VNSGSCEKLRLYWLFWNQVKDRCSKVRERAKTAERVNSDLRDTDTQSLQVGVFVRNSAGRPDALTVAVDYCRNYRTISSSFPVSEATTVITRPPGHHRLSFQHIYHCQSIYCTRGLVYCICSTSELFSKVAIRFSPVWFSVPKNVLLQLLVDMHINCSSLDVPVVCGRTFILSK